MGKISNLRSLRDLQPIYRLQGQDHPPQDIATENPITVVHDVSREAEMLSPESYLGQNLFLAKLTFANPGAGVSQSEYLEVTPANVIGLPATFQQSYWRPWVISAAFGADGSGQYGAVSLYLARKTHYPAQEAIPEYLGYTSTWARPGATDYYPSQIASIYLPDRPYLVNWGDQFRFYITGAGTGLDNGYFYLGLHLTPSGAGTWGMR